MLLHLARKSIQIPRTLMPAQPLPCRQRLARSLYCRIDIRRVGLRNVGNLFAIRRIVRRKILTRRRLLPFATNIEVEAPLVPIKPSLHLFRILRRRTIVHRIELFNNQVAHRTLLMQSGGGKRRSSGRSRGAPVAAQYRQAYYWPQSGRDSVPATAVLVHPSSHITTAAPVSPT